MLWCSKYLYLFNNCAPRKEKDRLPRSVRTRGSIYGCVLVLYIVSDLVKSDFKFGPLIPSTDLWAVVAVHNSTNCSIDSQFNSFNVSSILEYFFLPAISFAAQF